MGRRATGYWDIMVPGWRLEQILVLALAERLVSERGRAAIHEAELVEAAAEDGTGMLPVVRSA
jgi:hypothetical protein